MRLIIHAAIHAAVFYTFFGHLGWLALSINAIMLISYLAGAVDVIKYARAEAAKVDKLNQAQADLIALHESLKAINEKNNATVN